MPSPGLAQFDLLSGVERQLIWDSLHNDQEHLSSARMILVATCATLTDAAEMGSPSAAEMRDAIREWLASTDLGRAVAAEPKAQ